jgi:cell division protein FtsI/penicillin-binding protein 2
MKRLLALVLGFGMAVAPMASPTWGASPTSNARRVRRPVARARLYDPTVGDSVDGDDLTIRQAAVNALGSQQGSVVVVDPTDGRVLTIVNQKLALKSGFIPCSTIKLVTALAALSEHLIERDTVVHLSRRLSFNLTNALAVSNNDYFAYLGRRLGFERVVKYAQMLGLGEKAGLDIEGEQAGEIVSEEPREGGVGMMTSFGTGFLVTPLELAGLLTGVANGGTLYYLQYPRTAAESEGFNPRIKRALEVASNDIDDIKVGMRGAVDFGTARRASYDPTEPVFGKTGTCTDYHAGATFMGWFGSFTNSGPHQVVVVVMLTSPMHNVSGPLASGVAGAFYRNLAAQQYFASDTPRRDGLPEILITKPCCAR